MKAINQFLQQQQKQKVLTFLEVIKSNERLAMKIAKCAWEKRA